MATPVPTEQATKVKVKLVKAHTHRGELKKPADEIEVTVGQKKWLEGQGIINKPAG